MPEPEGEGAPQPRGTLQTVSRALSALELFRHSGELGVRQIARRLKISPTAAHRIMSTLAAHGYLTQEADSRGYRLGPKIRELTDSVALSETDVRRLALPHLRELQDRTGETVCLHTAQDGYRVCLMEIESPQELRMVVPLRPFPILRAAATDQIFRVFADPETLRSDSGPDDDLPEIDRRIEEGSVEPPDLELVRRRGWAVSYGVRIAGAISLAAPVLTPAGMLAISVFGPAERIASRGVEEMARDVTAVAVELSAALRVHQSPGPVHFAATAR